MIGEKALENLKMAAKKTEKIFCRAQGRFPFCGFNEQGEYKLYDDCGWTAGFFPGMLYIAASAGLGDEFIKMARCYDEPFDRIAEKKLAQLGHDLGFVFSIKDVFDYRLTGSEFHRKRALVAAEELFKRYRPGAGIIPAWDSHPFDSTVDYRGRIICDTMMNMPFLMWAYEQTGDERYKEAAINHSRKAARHLIREDGSSYHVYDFDPETGEAKGGKTMQGYSDDSCWSRGQSWLVYGFALMYRYTDDEEFLEAAEKTAGYFAENISAYGLPLWDFSVAELAFRPWDASAGAVAVCGMLEITKFEKCPEKREYFKRTADRIMESLTNLCATLHTPELEPVLLHVPGSPVYRKGSEHTLEYLNGDTAIIYGDYFYMEALMRYACPEAVLPW